MSLEKIITPTKQPVNAGIFNIEQRIRKREKINDT